jgi:hypothetical protein
VATASLGALALADEEEGAGERRHEAKPAPVAMPPAPVPSPSMMDVDAATLLRKEKEAKSHKAKDHGKKLPTGQRTRELKHPLPQGVTRRRLRNQIDSFSLITAGGGSEQWLRTKRAPASWEAGTHLLPLRRCPSARLCCPSPSCQARRRRWVHRPSCFL